MLRILESQAPAKQTATDTISTLSSRLTSATLLEDRRAAVLGLRSFAKQYPASVASGALRDLITGLRRDGEDSDTIKAELETILGLFEPDANSPEASDEITLWLADEFSQRPDNVTALLDLLELGETFPRLYSLKILGHVSAARPQRTQETVFSAPLGLSRITAVLDDRREHVRLEALALLVALTSSSPELQKVVAFENAFDRTFRIIETDGGLNDGSDAVRESLSLLANLLRLNVSNQSYFREIGGIARLAKLLAGVLKEETSDGGWTNPRRDMNIWGTLAIAQLFLGRGAQGTPLNQAAFWKRGLVLLTLRLSFHSSMSVSIRAKALETCGDMIRGNSKLQEQFGDLTVQLAKEGHVSPITTNGHTMPTPSQNNTTKAAPVHRDSNVIEALLGLALVPSPMSLFDVRLAACSCLKAFFEGHAGIRLHVLRRAIDGYRSGDDAVPNILTVLMEPPGTASISDLYQQWMATVILMHLLIENTETKSMALAVSEGDAENGEEVVTFVQAVTANVIASAQRPEYERAIVGYLMLLSMWLFEDPDAVNDLLGEGSNVQGLIAVIKITSASMPLVAGLCAFLLGVVYEFSTKDSPIPRPKLHDVLVNNLGREIYIDRLSKLRENSLVRDFEVLSGVDEIGSPEVYFDSTFVDFLKDNFSRMLRAIDRDPGFEVSVMSNGVQKGVSRELVDTLRAEVEEHKRQLELANNELLELRRKVEQEELDHRRTRESTTVELTRIKQINQSLHNNHEEELQSLRQDFDRRQNKISREHNDTMAKLQADHSATVAATRRQLEAEHQRSEQNQQERERNFAASQQSLTEQHRTNLKDVNDRLQHALERHDAETADLQATIDQLRAQLSKTEKDHSQDLQTAHEEYKTSTTSLEGKLTRAEERAKDGEARSKEVSKELEELTTSKKDVQTELDDLLVVFADLEAKRAADKSKLKELGAEVSDDEGDGEEVGEEDDEEEGEKEDGVD